jgi:hypothetical protein
MAQVVEEQQQTAVAVLVAQVARMLLKQVHLLQLVIDTTILLLGQPQEYMAEALQDQILMLAKQLTVLAVQYVLFGVKVEHFLQQIQATCNIM